MDRRRAALDAGHPEWAELPETRPEAKAAGASRYFTGKPCKAGHVAPRWSAGWHCDACYRECDRTIRASYYSASAAHRRALTLKATPKWLTDDDKAAIRVLYEEAARLTIESGITHHVDHVFPLRAKSRETGKRVGCGLHLPANLQVIPGSENVSRGCWLEGEALELAAGTF